MSFNNFADINPLVAVYENNSYTTSDKTAYMPIDTSLYNGTVSSNILTLEYACTLRGDFYGYTYDTANLMVNSMFYVDSVEQYQSVDTNAGGTFTNFGGGEVFFANAPANVPIRARRRNAGMSVTTEAKFPRITGVLIQ
tara:strand:- start:565 stop:981 length:417 start_codon:yes stop_codon:yes gene_type:complete